MVAEGPSSRDRSGQSLLRIVWKKPERRPMGPARFSGRPHGRRVQFQRYLERPATGDPSPRSHRHRRWGREQAVLHKPVTGVPTVVRNVHAKDNGLRSPGRHQRADPQGACG